MADDNTGAASATDDAAGDDTNTGTDDAAGAAGQGTDDGLADAGRKALAEERRARKAAEAELARLRKASMSEQEKAVADAKAAGADEASKAAAPRLVRAELKAAAAEAGVPKATLDGFLEYADLSRFVGEGGEIDEKAIGTAVKRLGGTNGRTNFDGGARDRSTAPTDMSAFIRRSAGVG
jgi:hypothetical protein